MSVQLVSSSTQYLTSGAVSVIGAPLTMACWAYPDSDPGTTINAMLYGETGSNNFFSLLTSYNLGGDPAQAQARNIANIGTSSGGSMSTTGQWYHMAGVFATTASRTAYLDGSAGTEDTTSVTPSLSAPVVRIGANRTGSGAWDGRVAEAAIWSVALDTAEIAALAKGVCPLLVRPASLFFYAPLIRDIASDYIIPATLSGTNTPTVGAHAPIIRPHRKKIRRFTTATGAATGNPWYAYAQQ